jgi:hypothetical protein
MDVVVECQWPETIMKDVKRVNLGYAFDGLGSSFGDTAPAVYRYC